MKNAPSLNPNKASNVRLAFFFPLARPLCTDKAAARYSLRTGAAGRLQRTSSPVTSDAGDLPTPRRQPQHVTHRERAGRRHGRSGIIVYHTD